MKKRVRPNQTVPFYSNEPAVSRKLIADQGLTQNASLGNQPPKMVDKKPSRMSGLAGFTSKNKPKGKPSGIPQVGPGGPKPAKVPSQGHLRASGHPGAHRIGNIKLKV